MRRRMKLMAVAGLVLMLTFVLTGGIVAAQPPEMVKVLIGFDRQPSPDEESIVRRTGGTIKYTYHLVPAIAASVPETAIEGLRKNPRVTSVDLDGEVHIIDHNITAGDIELNNTWGVKHIGAGAVHNEGNKGTGVSVAVIDTGIDYTHPDLDANFGVIKGYDFVNNDADPMDDNDHGTHVTGTIAAEDDGAGVVGVAPSASIYALKVLDAGGGGYWSDIIAALQWAVDNGIQVTNNSYGSSLNPGGTVKAAFDNSAAVGILHVASAGNSGNPKGKGNNVSYPARFQSVIAVAATDGNNNRASFSSTGDAVELAAPGVKVNSTKRGGGYVEWNGTSMASPHVAGTAALVIASGITDTNGNGWINDEVRARLQQTANELGDSGKDSQYGWGLVDADEAAPPPAGNRAPVADAGSDQSVNTGSTVQLDGTGSYDPDGDPTTYSWTFVSKPTDSTATLSGADTATPTFVTDVDGTYEANLTVSDGELSDSDTVVITAGPNQAPVANAGSDQSMNTGSTVQLDGTGSYDPDGDPITYSWAFVSKPTDSTATLSGADTATPTFTADVDGAYEVELTVSDAELSASDRVIITTAMVTEPTTVSVTSITYATEGGRNRDKHLNITVALEDNLGNAVAGASVSIDLKNTTNGQSWTGTGTTGTNGTVTFSLNNAPSGTYTTIVTGVTATGLTWDDVTPGNSFAKP